MMHLLSSLFIIAALDVSLIKSEPQNLFSLDGFDESIGFIDPTTPPPLNSDLSSLGFDSSIFSNTYIPNNDIGIPLLFGDEDVGSTLMEASLPSDCSAQGEILKNEQSLLSTRNDRICSPSLPAFPPETLQLFDNPLGLLEKIVPTTEKDTSGSSDPGIYPGRLTPEEEESRETELGPFHNSDPVEGQEWQDYKGKVTTDDSDNPCKLYLEQGYIEALCCSGKFNRVGGSLGQGPTVYYWYEGCDANPGPGTFVPTTRFVSHCFFKLKQRFFSAGNVCAGGNAVCCKRYVSYPFAASNPLLKKINNKAKN